MAVSSVARVLPLALLFGIALACAGAGSGEGAPAETEPPTPPGGDAAASPDPDASAARPKFALEAKTEMASGAVALRTNLPATTAACAALPSEGAPCADADGDGLVDAWEDLVLERMRPRIELDEEEPLVKDPTAKVAFVGRVTPRVTGVGIGLVMVYVIIAYSKDYGSCAGASAHNGDNERVVFEVSVQGGDATMTRAYTAAHEGSPTDDGHVYTGAALQTDLRYFLEKEGPRWLVFSSQSKHATYANIAACEGHSAVPCLEEDCGADNVPDAAPFQILPTFANAGEPDKPRTDDLTALGFPNERAWATTNFCGGLGGTSCASANKDKLTVDPFK